MLRTFGRTGAQVSPIGLASSYGAPASAFEEAFDLGCNYFYWGSFRTDAMGDAFRNIVARSPSENRKKLYLVLQSYARLGPFVKWSVKRGLRNLQTEYADLLLLGWYNDQPNNSVLDAALELKEKGIVKGIGISCHHRPSFEKYIKDGRFDMIMVRYNAAHRGAEREVFPHLANLPKNQRPGVVTYTSTRWGMLTNPKFTPSGMRTPTASDCYRFALSHPDVDVTLTGPATLEQMRANIEFLKGGESALKMSPDELQWMKSVGDAVHRATAKKRFTNPFVQRTQ